MSSKLDIFIAKETGLLAIGFKESRSDYLELSREDIALLIRELPDYRLAVASNEEF